MARKNVDEYNFLDRARKLMCPQHLRRLHNKAKHHAAQAEYIQWPALQESWQVEVDGIRAILDERGINP